MTSSELLDKVREVSRAGSENTVLADRLARTLTASDIERLVGIIRLKTPEEVGAIAITLTSNELVKTFSNNPALTWTVLSALVDALDFTEDVHHLDVAEAINNIAMIAYPHSYRENFESRLKIVIDRGTPAIAILRETLQFVSLP